MWLQAASVRSATSSSALAINLWGGSNLCSNIGRAVPSKRVLKKTKAKFQAGAGDGREVVRSTASSQLEMQRSVILMTERDLRRLTGLTRIPKSMLKGVPQLQLPTEKPGATAEQSTEVNYVFADPDQPWKKGIIKVSLGSSLDKEELQPAEIFRAGQAKDTQNHLLRDQQRQSGLDELLNKEVTGHLQLQSLDDFMENRCTDPSAALEGEGGAEEHGASSLQPVALVGVAAQDLEIHEPALPKKAKTSPAEKTPQMFRSNSTSSVAVVGTSPEQASSLDPTPEKGDDVRTVRQLFPGALSSMASEIDAGPENLDKTSLSYGVSQGRAWKTKLDINAVLAGTADGRSIIGLKRAAERALSKPATRSEGYVLNNYHKLVAAAQAIAPGNIASMTYEKIQQNVALMEEEGIALPVSVKEAITTKTIDNLILEAKYEQLLEVIAPFGSTQWQVATPTLNGLQDMTTSLRLWKKHLFQDTFTKLVEKGQTASQQVAHLTKLSLTMLQQVDLLDLTTAQASTVEEGLCILNCLQDLLNPSIAMLGQDIGGKQGNREDLE
eukprot:6363831-Amphidinium_carterae.1